MRLALILVFCIDVSSPLKVYENLMGSDPMKSLDNVIVRKAYTSREQPQGVSRR